MASTGLQYKNKLGTSGGYSNGISKGEIGSWSDVALSGKHSATFYWDDKGTTGGDARTSLVVTDTWTAEIDDDNTITITVTTTMQGKRKKTNSCTGYCTREIGIWDGRKASATMLKRLKNQKITKDGSYSMPAHTKKIILKPGESTDVGTLFILNAIPDACSVSSNTVTKWSCNTNCSSCKACNKLATSSGACLYTDRISAGGLFKNTLKAPTCGTTSASSETQKFSFTTSNKNPILLSKTEHSGTCYTASQSYNASNDPLGLMATALAAAGQWSTAKTWALHPFHIEAKGNVHFSYNSNGELIVTLKDVISTLTGTAGDAGNAFQAYLYTGGYFSWAVNAKLVTASNPSAPGKGDSGWKKCMGGWWSAAPTANCTSHCPGGGTLYWWNAWNKFGTAYEKHGNTPTRKDNNISWNLGVPKSDSQVIALFARAARGNCSNAAFSSADGDAQQCIFFTIPAVNICPPELNSVVFERDICEERITATLNVTTPDNQMETDLVVQYEAIDDPNDWEDRKAKMQVFTNVASKSTFDVTLDESLIPNTTYCFRIYLQADGKKSDPVTLCGQPTPYIPPVTCMIPLFKETECETLKIGDCIDEFTDADMEECC